MIARLWRGRVRSADADAYLDFLRARGLSDYRSTPGNLGVHTLRRIAGGEATFLLLTHWESEAAIREFAGDDWDRARYYPEDDGFLLEKEERVRHFSVVAAPAVTSVLTAGAAWVWSGSVPPEEAGPFGELAQRIPPQRERDPLSATAGVRFSASRRQTRVEFMVVTWFDSASAAARLELPAGGPRSAAPATVTGLVAAHGGTLEHYKVCYTG